MCGLFGFFLEENVMNAFVREFMSAAREAPRLFFAPLIGAINDTREAMRDDFGDARQEMDRRKHENAKGRDTDS
jgi:hypothetical protein